MHQRGNQANSKHIDGIKAAGEITASCSIGNRGRFCIVLKSSRFFRGGSRPGGREGYADDKSKVTEYLYRRVDLEDLSADDQLSIAVGHRSTPYCARNLSSVEPIRTLMP